MQNGKRRLCRCAGLLLLLCLLSGCGRSLGERAIVKMIYLDEDGGQVQAALAVFTCVPNSDTASVEGEAKIYTAQGADIEEALYRAERQQNKKPFYAQNEILLLGPGAARDATRYLEHFARENAARPNTAVFLTPLTADEFSECEAVVGSVVREGERLIGKNVDGRNCTQSLYEIDLSGASGMNGYLPVFSFSAEEKDFCGVRRLVLFRDGAPCAAVEDVPMQLFLLLMGKTDRIAGVMHRDGQSVSFETERLRLTRTAGARGGRPALTVRLEGMLHSVTVDGVPVPQTDGAAVARQISAYLTQTAQTLQEMTFAQGNDLFCSAWWMRQYDAAACEALERSGLLHTLASVEVRCALEWMPLSA